MTRSDNGESIGGSGRINTRSRLKVATSLLLSPIKEKQDHGEKNSLAHLRHHGLDREFLGSRLPQKQGVMAMAMAKSDKRRQPRWDSMIAQRSRAFAA